ncbi:MAG: STAS domain-containing protein [candidate division FCPU426 bacterium]
MKVPVPLIKIGQVVLAPIEIELTDEMAEELHLAILKKIELTHARGLVIDVSLVEVIDSYFARILINIGRAAHCLNCMTVVVGITPEVAFTLTQMGLTWRGVRTALTVEEAISMVQAHG